ncbi:MAG: hypothetical protein IT307_09675 [Chloroflexi bacterium]|nr:hypothetical protein [Chloroflexota bacterium]
MVRRDTPARPPVVTGRRRSEGHGGSAVPGQRRPEIRRRSLYRCEIDIASPDIAGFATRGNGILGNTGLDRAMAGRLLAADIAGEQSAVRGGGAGVLADGAGDRGREYMTGGTVALLGGTSRDVAGDLSNGVAYMLDSQGRFLPRVVPEVMDLERLIRSEDLGIANALVQERSWRTGRPRSRDQGDTWNDRGPGIVKVVPSSTPMPPVSLTLSSAPRRYPEAARR